MNSSNEIKLEKIETRQGVCYERGTVRLREEPNFCWIKLDPGKNFQPESDDLEKQIKEGLRIIIMRAEIQNCRLSKKISIAQRRNARPTQGVKVVSGSFAPEPQKLPWKLWPENDNHPEALGLKIFVDTLIASFLT